MKKQSAETNSKDPKLARRDFVKTTAAAGAGLLIVRAIKGAIRGAVKGVASSFTSAQFALQMIEISDKLRFQLTA
jgi:hypothetical protein